jgi:serpin B
MKTAAYLMVICLTAAGLNAKSNPPEDGTAMDTITEGNTAFAVDLYQQLKAEEGNLFFSPYSLSTALAMVYGGAKGQTAGQMAQTLHFDPNDDAFHEHYGRLIEQLNEQGEKENYKLLVANALWGQKDFGFLDPYLNLTKHNYGARLELVDYVNAAEEARQTINAWVEDKTEEKIKDLIPAGALDRTTRLVLTNAIYFKGDWAEPFDKTETKPAPFYISPEKTVQAPLMHRKADFKYGEAASFRYAQGVRVQILEMPYHGDELSMAVLLPEKGYLRHLEEDLTAETLKGWTSNLKTKEVDVFLPKFKMTSQFVLNDTLGRMGMAEAFTPAADFSGMTGQKDLFISQVVHKAYVDVNEEGTEAAAATGVMMKLSSMPGPRPEPIIFRADRPFLFLIKDNKTGAILFMGRVANPVEENSKS